MALDKQNFTIVLGTGVDTKVDPKQLAPTKLSVLENGVFDKTGALIKRPGNTALSTSIATGGNLSTGFALLNKGDNIIQSNKYSLYSYMPASSNWTTLSSNVTAVNTDEYATTQLIRAVSNGFECVASLVPASTYTVSFSVYEQQTGVLQQTYTYNTSGIPLIKLMVVGTYFIGVFSDGLVLQYIAIQSSYPYTASGPTTLASDMSGGFDICNLGTSLYFAYSYTTGIKLFSLSSVLIQSSITTIAAEDAGQAIGISADSVLSRLWVSYASSTTVKYLVRSSAFASVLAPTTIEALANVYAITSIASNGSGYIVYQVYSGSTATPYLNNLKKATANDSGTVSTAFFLRGMSIQSKPFSYNSIPYIPMVYDDLAVQNTYFVASLLTGSIITKAVDLLAGFSQFETRNTICETIQTASNTFEFTGAKTLNVNINFGAAVHQNVGYRRIRLEFPTLNNFAAVNSGGALIFDCGLPSYYDGQTVAELNFNLYPSNVTGTVLSGSGNLSAGSYSYAVTYEWTDLLGNVHRSTPSEPITKTATMGDRVSLVIPNLRITAKTTQVNIVVYRTLANGTVYYRVTSLTSPTINSTSANTTTYVDGLSDANAQGNDQLYTNGGQVDNTPPPVTRCFCIYKNRIIAVPRSNATQVYYTKTLVPGTAVSFSETSFYLVANQGGQEIQSALQMDDKLIMFQPDNILYTVGDGPADTGAQNDFSDPQLIATGCGSEIVKSLVLSQIGTFFQSKKGFYLLDRSLAAMYIGNEVEAYNADTTLTANIIPKTTIVKFELLSGATIFYDYFQKQWGVNNGINSLSSKIINNVYNSLRSDGTIYQSSLATYADNSSFVSMKLRTSWVQLAGVQGYQRAYRLFILGEYKSPHNLIVQIAYDFDSTVVQTVTIPVTSALTPYQFRVQLARQKCEAIQVTIYDTQNGTAGESYSISDLQIQIGVKKGSQKLPFSQTYT